MNHEVICKNFEPTEAIRDSVGEHIGDLQSLSGRPLFFHVFLSKTGPDEFTARFQSRLWHKELYSEAKNENLYQAITLAKQNFRRQLIDANQKHRAGI